MIGVTNHTQSWRLQAAGLKRETADMCDLLIRPVNMDNYWHLGVGYFESDENNITIPVWSMGHLWQILHDNGIYFYEYATNDPVEKVMESLVCAVERASRQGRINPQ